MFKLNSCCFCIALQDGALIIAIIDLFLTIILIISGSEHIKRPIGIIVEVLFAIHLIACIILVLAVIEDRIKFCIPWLITALIKTICYIVFFVLMLLQKVVIKTIVWGLIHILAPIYFWLCIISYYGMDRDSDEDE